MNSEKDFLEQIKNNQGIIYKLVGVYFYEEQAKKDMYQEILLQCWKGWQNFKHDSKFSTWLYRITLNTILTCKRKTEIIDYTYEIDEQYFSTDDSATNHEDKNRLLLAINKLNEIDKALITLHLEGFSNPEICEILGISLSNCGVKIFRIKQQLATFLNK
jgi:RNA polymerase sigma factor (sigma-70 family)